MKFILSNVTFVLGVISPSAAIAYIGPGAGLSAIGAAIALVGAIVLGIVGFLWYPVKRLLGRKKTPEGDENMSEPEITENSREEPTLTADRTSEDRNERS